MLTALASLQNNAYAKEGEFFTFNPRISQTAIYHGSIPASGLVKTPGIVYASKIFQSTREYEELKKTSGEAEKINLNAKGSLKVHKWILDYSKESDLELLLEGSRISGSDLISVPESYKGMSKKDVFARLDVSSAIIKANSK